MKTIANCKINANTFNGATIERLVLTYPGLQCHNILIITTTTSGVPPHVSTELALKCAITDYTTTSNMNATLASNRPTYHIH